MNTSAALPGLGKKWGFLPDAYGSGYPLSPLKGLFVAYRRIYRQSLTPFATNLRPTGLKVQGINPLPVLTPFAIGGWHCFASEASE